MTAPHRIFTKSGQGLGQELAVFAVSLVSLLLPALSCTCVFAQSSDWKPGDPINLGHVHKQYGEDGSGASPTYASPMPVESTIVKQAPILQGSASTKFLQGGVQHSEQLAPVQSGLKVGTTFDESKLEKIAPARIWYRVPPWMAGRWQYDDYTQTYFEDYKKGSIDSQAKTSAAQAGETWGSQHDRLGGVWDEMILPATKDTTADKDLYKDAHTDDSVIFDSDARFIVRLVSTRTRIDKATNTIRDVNQVEQFTTLLPAGPGKIRNDYSFKYFDPRGSKVSLSKGWRIGRKVAPFAPNNYDENNQDVRPAFRDYLKSNGLDNLVPLDQ